MTNVTSPNTAKVFTTGRSQAERVPKGFRVATKEGTIEWQGNAVRLLPKRDSATWAEQMMAAVAAFDPDFKIKRPDEWVQTTREELLP